MLYYNSDVNAVIPTCQKPTYEPWTYKQFGKLVCKIKQEVANRGIDNFKVVLQFIGGATMYYNAENTCEGWVGRTEENNEKANYNIKGKWLIEHTEIDAATYNCYYLGSKINVPADKKILKEENSFFWKYFA